MEDRRYVLIGRVRIQETQPRFIPPRSTEIQPTTIPQPPNPTLILPSPTIINESSNRPIDNEIVDPTKPFIESQLMVENSQHILSGTRDPCPRASGGILESIPGARAPYPRASGGILESIHIIDQEICVPPRTADQEDNLTKDSKDDYDSQLHVDKINLIENHDSSSLKKSASDDEFYKIDA